MHALLTFAKWTTAIVSNVAPAGSTSLCIPYQLSQWQDCVVCLWTLQYCIHCINPWYCVYCREYWGFISRACSRDPCSGHCCRSISWSLCTSCRGSSDSGAGYSAKVQKSQLLLSKGRLWWREWKGEPSCALLECLKVVLTGQCHVLVCGKSTLHLWVWA